MFPFKQSVINLVNKYRQDRAKLNAFATNCSDTTHRIIQLIMTVFIDQLISTSTSDSSDLEFIANLTKMFNCTKSIPTSTQAQPSPLSTSPTCNTSMAYIKSLMIKRSSDLSVRERFAILKSIGMECIQDDELLAKLESSKMANKRLLCYDGLNRVARCT